MVGVEMAGVAKNAAALGAAAAEAHGLNAAGIAAATIWRECVAYALASGARLDTFTGLGRRGPDRNRDRAGEPEPPRRRAARRRRCGGQIPGQIGQVAEGLDSVPLLAESMARGDIEAPGPGRAFRPDQGSHRPGRVGGRTAARGANPSCGIGMRRCARQGEDYA